MLGAVPYALVAAAVLTVDAGTLDDMAFLHAGSGVYAGPGHAALSGLLAPGCSDGRRRPVVSAVSALGRRSLSGYVVQSVVWTIIFAPFALSLGGSAYVAIVAAAAVWAVSVLAARAMEARRHAGPAERLLRRLTYGPR